MVCVCIPRPQLPLQGWEKVEESTIYPKHWQAASGLTSAWTFSACLKSIAVTSAYCTCGFSFSNLWLLL